MKAFFIYRDGKKYGSPIGYTTEKGAKKSLVGCEDWYREMMKYYKWHAKTATPPQELIDMKMYEWSEYVNCWLFDRSVWSRKIWTPYMKEHYQIIEQDYNINVKGEV